MKSLQQRFEEKYIPEPNSGCWLWTAYINPAGYGMMYVVSRMELSHRIAYRLYVGEIKNNLCVCHKCDVPSCVNPEHLWLGTHQDNMEDMVRKGRKLQGFPGIKNIKAKLTESDVFFIRTSCLKPTDLSVLFNVSYSTINRVRSKRSWAHI